jgi:hypothetical protein
MADPAPNHIPLPAAHLPGFMPVHQNPYTNALAATDPERHHGSLEEFDPSDANDPNTSARARVRERNPTHPFNQWDANGLATGYSPYAIKVKTLTRL